MGRRGVAGAPASIPSTREGLAEAVSDAQVVVEWRTRLVRRPRRFWNSSKDPAATCCRGGRRGRRTSRRVVVVGPDRLRTALSTGKLARRRSSKRSAFPTRSFKATQFFESSSASSGRRQRRTSSACHRRSSSRSPRRCRPPRWPISWWASAEPHRGSGRSRRSGSMRWRGDFWPPPATKRRVIGTLTRCIRHQTRDNSLTAAIRRGIGPTRFRGLARRAAA